jgi:hypothetical protein
VEASQHIRNGQSTSITQNAQNMPGRVRETILYDFKSVGSLGQSVGGGLDTQTVKVSIS